MQQFDPRMFIIELVVIVLSITLHEFGHAISADRLGDPGPRRDGRITLWPDKHFDIFGFVMICVTLISGFGLGWGKPVMVNPRNFRNPQRDMIIVAICGPVMNLLLAIVFGLLLRIMIATGHPDWMLDSTTGQFAWSFVVINLSLMYFNLIPIPPLDGSKVLYGLLPYEQAAKYERFMAQWGLILLIILLVTGSLSVLILPAVNATFRIIVGI